MRQIITNFDDNDLYKESTGQMIWSQFPEIKAHWVYINRAKDKRYRPGFGTELAQQVSMMADLQRTSAMQEFYRTKTPWLKSTFREWRASYRYNPSEVKIEQTPEGELKLDIFGLARRVTYWEVPLLSTITELKRMDPETGNMMEKAPGWDAKITEKGQKLADAGVSWIEFGTRRRFDLATQREVIKRQRAFAPHFRGTSNPMLAQEYNVPVFGTYPHEHDMMMQPFYGLLMAGRKALDHWIEEYRGNLGIALTDTLTTDVFFRYFFPENGDPFYAKLFDGVRHDSGDPFAFAKRVIAGYERLRIDPTTKILVFSDNLNVDKAIALHKEFGKQIRVTMGIGTHLTNDVGYEASNHVIKLVEVDYGEGWVPVIKLSDDSGKHLGGSAVIADAFRQLRIAA